MTMEKRDDLIGVLKEMKNTNVTYKQIADKLNIKVNTLYTWIHTGNISEKKAAYVLKQIERHFPDEYIYAIIAYSIHATNEEIRAAREAGNTLA